MNRISKRINRDPADLFIFRGLRVLDVPLYPVLDGVDDGVLVVCVEIVEQRLSCMVVHILHVFPAVIHVVPGCNSKASKVELLEP